MFHLCMPELFEPFCNCTSISPVPAIGAEPAGNTLCQGLQRTVGIPNEFHSHVPSVLGCIVSHWPEASPICQSHNPHAPSPVASLVPPLKGCISLFAGVKILRVIVSCWDHFGCRGWC